ncbi:hypothetical protein CC86DRAFT_390694 [Ophiobolus disseminans]|uniref:DUF3752 domain-containing protein n=1 Tax=Ophiobolus disseminans TaxID=1469910 RepID=A0A6A7ACS1_9PLEO|nr:hypothetical protein CC86DRAFT_390694 [Ophiobolus disseminans]
MPSIGPTLPPHLAKRSRDDDDDGDSSPDSGDKRRRVAGPAPPPSANAPRRNVGPSLPPNARSRSSSEDSDVGPAPPKSSHPARVAGPTAPPAPLHERPPNPPSDDSDSSDDDFGPAPPPAGANTNSYHDDQQGKSAFDTNSDFAEAPKKAQRDDWMTMPPTQDDLAARMDPTKMRARKFNTGKSAGGGGGMSSAWTETPEQKLKRLQDEAMGIVTPSNAAAAPVNDSKKSKEEERRARKMREKIDAARGKSLVEQHEEKGTGKEKEDDPSKRAFDYEKDMAVIGTANHKQRREMLSKSKGFSDRFSSGNFL